MRRIKIPIEKAIGEKIPHDFTKISPREGYKGAYFKRGHIIRKEDISILKSMGKNYIYKLILDDDELHEDDFALLIAPHLAGKNIVFSSKPSEGKIVFRSAVRGLFKLNKRGVIRLNSIDITSFPTIHNNFPVDKNQQVAAFRIIPLVAKRRFLDRALKIAEEPLIWVEEYKIKRASIVVTGTELVEGRVKDLFIPKIKAKLDLFGVRVEKTCIVKDDFAQIEQKFIEFSNSELVIVTGGSSVDPDDVTKKALKRAKVRFIREGNPIQPANNFTIGYFGKTVVCIVPAGALFYPTSAFDIFLPRLLARDRISKKEIAEYSVGGLCHFCKVCVYPVCPFGKV